MATHIKTIFVDIDGCIVTHMGEDTKDDLLPGVEDAFKMWTHRAYKIIITTGRRESQRKHTVAMLRKLGLHYDQLIMGLPRGPRIVINDRKPDYDGDTAIGINVVRNAGLVGIDV